MKVIDLFSGCGGFSLGARQAGLDVACSYDIDADLTYSYRHNFPSSALRLVDVSQLDGSQVLIDAGGAIDGVIGGPPCQGFSSIGKRDENDPRRKLLDHYFRLVSELQPKFFVMENVVGLQQGSAILELESSLERIISTFDVVGPTILDASEYGAATKRRRLFVIGFRKDLLVSGFEDNLRRERAKATTVKDAISDLTDITLIGAEVDGRYLIREPDRASAYARRMHKRDCTVSSNARTKHTDAVIKRFSSVPPGSTERVGRHPRLHWSGLCPTLRAGTGVDKGSFQSVRPIHPSEDRVITVREAARLQGFPDEFEFHPTIWHSFRMIGNSVSPIISRAVLRAIIGCVKAEGGQIVRPRRQMDIERLC